MEGFLQCNQGCVPANWCKQAYRVHRVAGYLVQMQRHDCIITAHEGTTACLAFGTG